ncbi:hypothetical protein OE88DRAFT_1643907 [Heliocybe sulcata]|uniref:Uncharacterized protein n=1 Tax=Heliocybe sulcata TaxID=5364 RepID=A0A5C3N4T5_9AGAM|nr:hypothetical protein OE88DRAFT_1643907 [Heliocybe sulcata]
MEVSYIRFIDDAFNYYLIGLYIALFGVALYLYRTIGCRSTLTIKKVSLCTAVVLFGLSTAQIAVYFVAYYRMSSVVMRLAGYGGVDLPDYTSEYDQALMWWSNVSIVILCAQITIADGLLVWRCYNVWDKNKVLLSVLATLLAIETASGFAMAFDIPTVLGVIVAYLYFPSLLAMNLFVSGLIAGRILWHRHKISTLPIRIPTGRVEAGVGYWVCALLLTLDQFVLINADGAIMQVAAGMGASVSCTLLMVLVELGKTTEHGTIDDNSASNETGRTSTVEWNSVDLRRSGNQVFAVSPLTLLNLKRVPSPSDAPYSGGLCPLFFAVGLEGQQFADKGDWWFASFDFHLPGSSRKKALPNQCSSVYVVYLLPAVPLLLGFVRYLG